LSDAIFTELLILLLSVKPQSTSGGTTQELSLREGEKGAIKVEVLANPEPKFEWTIDGKEDQENYTSSRTLNKVGI